MIGCGAPICLGSQFAYLDSVVNRRMRQEAFNQRVTVTITHRNPAHVRLSIWVNGGLICQPAGICLRCEELPEFIDRLALNEVWESMNPRNPEIAGTKTMEEQI